MRILLLRGINIGSNNRIAMGELRSMFAEAELGEAKTYLQSGNVVLRSEAEPGELAERARALIAERFGLSIPVVVRTEEQIAAVVERDPFAGEELSEKLYQVAFLDREPPADLAEQIAALAVGEERFVAHAREWYAYHPAGIARSKLATKIASRNLGVLATARNWATVRALHKLADDV